MPSHAIPTVAYELDKSRIEFVQQAILDWFAANGRDLPWRRTRDPYHILVSEVMLQQIQVGRAIPFYLAFISRFPTVRSLAGSPIAEVIRVWGDLGRYRRIGYLHRAAREIVDRFDGVVPSDIETLKSLPGVGPYTAGAVACFAYEQDVGFVDTNARRVIGRLFFGDAPSGGATHRELNELAARLVPKGRGWDWNQGLLDFGAVHCTARKPRCDRCPLAEVCTAYPLAIAPTQNATGRAKENVRGYEGTNRYYRGRILAALRDLESGQAESGIALSALAAQLKPETADDVSWLYEVVTGLEKDGLAQISEERPVYDPDDTGPAFVVRLPS